MKKMAKAPLSCKFKCGRDVPANLNVRSWMDRDIQNMGRARGREEEEGRQHQWTFIRGWTGKPDPGKPMDSDQNERGWE